MHQAYVVNKCTFQLLLCKQNPVAFRASLCCTLVTNLLHGAILHRLGLKLGTEYGAREILFTYLLINECYNIVV